MEGEGGEEQRGTLPLGGARVAALAEARVNVRDDRVEAGEDEGAEDEAGEHLGERSQLECRDEQAEGRRRQHDATGESKEGAEHDPGRVRDDEQEESADPGRRARGEDGGDGGRVHGSRP